MLAVKAEMLVNPVNLMGVMGKGLALQFKKEFPKNFVDYQIACAYKKIRIGIPSIFIEDGYKIVNFPTKNDWREPSHITYIIQGLKHLRFLIDLFKPKSVALPRLGCGLGGLDWVDVREAIEAQLGDLDVDIFVYGEEKE